MRKLFSSRYWAPLVIAVLSVGIANGAVPTLEEALDTEGLTWTTIGPAGAGWIGQTAVTHDGIDAAQSGAIAHSATNSISTTVAGPGTVGFWWKVSSETNSDRLIFFVNGVEQARLSGEVNWQSNSFILASGSQTLTWAYSKNGSITAGQDSGWVDQVAFSPGCTYSISPAMRNHGYGAATNTMTISAQATCAWTVSNPNSWITILSPAGAGNGTGTGVVTYAVSANTGMNARTGVVTIASQPFTIQQSGVPCNYSLNPGARNHGFATANNSITVLAGTNCAWSVVNTSLWITLTGRTNGVSTNTVSYTVARNTTPVQRTGNVMIADEKFVLSQNAAPCLYELSPTNRVHGHAGSTGLVTVTTTANCSWFVQNTNAWITITVNPSGLASGTFGYLVAPNPNAAPRNATFKVWDEVFTVFQQPASCSGSISPSSSSPNADSKTNIVTVTVAGGCAWTVVNPNTWISVSPASGIGDGSVTLIVAANDGLLGRTGAVSIANETYTVRQDSASCTYRLSPTNRIHGYGAATNTVSLDTISVCAWTVENTNNWVTIHSGPNGVGDANILYSISAHAGVEDRSAVLLIGGQEFLLTQRGIGCAISLSPSTRNHGHGASSNAVTVTSSPGCPWAAVNTNTWVTLVSGGNGSSNGVISYTVTANPTAFIRTGFITVEEDSVMLVQSAAPCSISLTPSALTHSPAQETGTVSVASAVGCAWTVNNTNSWITILSSSNGTGSTNVSYRVAANPDSDARSAVLTIGGEIFDVLQDGTVCSYKLSPTNRTHGYAAATNSVSVTVGDACPWFVENTNSWITILSGASGTGSSNVTYALAANALSPADRIGVLMIGGESLTLTQHGVTCTISLSPATRNHGFGANTNSVGVTAGAGCAWAVVNTNNWITIPSGASGTGTGTVLYVVAPNGNVTPRSGNILIGDEIFSVLQSGFLCSYRLSPTNRTHGFGANTNSVTITAGGSCAWAVLSTNDWITIVSGASGTGNSNFTYTISPNYGTTSRTGQVMVADQVLRLVQSASTGGFAFESMAMNANGSLTLKLNGGPPGIWDIQTSSNLVTWTKLNSITNTTGKVEFTAPANGQDKRFYRAVLP